MLKTSALAAALAIAAVIPALAAPPADVDACNKLAVDLANDPKSETLSEEDYAKFFGSIMALNQTCQDGDLAGAGAIADQIEAILNK